MLDCVDVDFEVGVGFDVMCWVLGLVLVFVFVLLLKSK